MSQIIIITCDGCDAESMPGVSRDELAEAGWRVRAPGGNDYCPDCRTRQRLTSRKEKRGKP